MGRVMGEGFEEVEEFFAGPFEGAVGGGHDAVGEAALSGLEVGDLLLEGVGGLDVVDEDGFGLADAVEAVRGLILDSRVPPAVDVDDVVGPGEVDAVAHGVEAAEGDVGLLLVEAVDAALSAGRLTAAVG